MFDDEIVIFGASLGGIKVAQTLESIGINFLYFVDNDKNKWGKMIEGKLIKSPQVLLNNNHKIIIASAYQEEIEKQLNIMGIKDNRILLKEKLIIKCLINEIDQFSHIKHDYSYQENEINYIIDIADGMEIGGIESWSFSVAKAFLNSNKKVILFSKMTDTKPPLGLENYIEMLHITYTDYKESIIEIVNRMKDLMPFTILASWMTQNFMAALILKYYFPKEVKIIGIVHHDMVGYYKRNQYLDKYIDKFLCVSYDIRSKMIKQYGIPEKKVFYKEVPIEIDKNYVKKYSTKKQPLQINIGSRLVKSKKRLDLLIPLIENMEEKGVKYHLNIAGEGPYFNIIHDYAKDNKIEDKITLYGGIKYEEMMEFWKKGDIVISISDSEGMGLSILEAMSCGAVPIVTNTAGIWDFVINDENGYICEINDVLSMAECIQKLDLDREKLCNFGNRSRKIIAKKCDGKSYINYIIDIENSI